MVGTGNYLADSVLISQISLYITSKTKKSFATQDLAKWWGSTHFIEKQPTPIMCE